MWARLTRAARRRLVLLFVVAFVALVPGTLLIFGVRSVYLVIALGAVLFGYMIAMTAVALAERRRAQR